MLPLSASSDSAAGLPDGGAGPEWSGSMGASIDAAMLRQPPNPAAEDLLIPLVASIAFALVLLPLWVNCLLGAVLAVCGVLMRRQMMQRVPWLCRLSRAPPGP